MKKLNNMKYNLLLICLCLNQLLSAQTFTEITNTPFPDVSTGSISFADIDGDNDEDLFLTGYSNIINPPRISRLYTNDGSGNFTEMINTPFEGISGSSCAFVDVDEDNDLDLFMLGANNSCIKIAKLYTNDGLGNFTEVPGSQFEGVSAGSIAFSDIDGDNDQDLLITGQDNSGEPITKMYANDGTANFTELLNMPFDSVESSSIAFSDIDGDNDQDVLICGKKGPFDSISKLYTNDGDGNFTEVMNSPLDSVQGSAAFVDVDGDNDQDIFITGQKDSFVKIAKLYLNDGLGNFSEVLGTPFEGTTGGDRSISFADIDGDNDQDVLITGLNNSLDRIAKLYTNDGIGNFSEVMDSFPDISFSYIAFSDVNGDNQQDLLMTGRVDLISPITKLYLNDGMISTSESFTGSLDFDFTIYPNPTGINQVYLTYVSRASSLLNVRVFSLEGKQLIKLQEPMDVGPQLFSINISSLPKGTYLIELEDGFGRGVRKLMMR